MAAPLPPNTGETRNQSVEKPYISTSDDATQYSSTTTNTLAGFLVDSGSVDNPRGPQTPDNVTRIRQQKEEAGAAINALNQFIFVAGHIYKGRRINKKDEKRLREAAGHVGLSLNVVDALIEQTADPNAIVKYCMASDDAFARKMKSDPQLARISQHRGSFEDESEFDVADSVWRVFMHKIIQQFLRDHGMEISDVMNKESLTSRLYEEALRNEKDDSSGARAVDSPRELARIRRDYTKEREKVSIPEEEAKWARQQAEANMSFEPHRPFLHLTRGHEEDYIISDLPPNTQDDILSLRPGIPQADDQSHKSSWIDNSQEVSGQRRSLKKSSSTAPRPLPTKPMASDGEGGAPLSAVKRGLAMFEKAADNQRGESPPKRQKRSSVENLSKSKVVDTCARFETGQVGGDEVATPERVNKPLTTPASTSKIKKLRPSATNWLETKENSSSPNGRKPDNSPGADLIDHTKSGKHVKSTMKLFEGGSKNDSSIMRKISSKADSQARQPPPVDTANQPPGRKPDKSPGSEIIKEQSVGGLVKTAMLRYQGEKRGTISEGEQEPVKSTVRRIQGEKSGAISEGESEPSRPRRELPSDVSRQTMTYESGHGPIHPNSNYPIPTREPKPSDTGKGTNTESKSSELKGPLPDKNGNAAMNESAPHLEKQHRSSIHKVEHVAPIQGQVTKPPRSNSQPRRQTDSTDEKDSRSDIWKESSNSQLNSSSRDVSTLPDLEESYRETIENYNGRGKRTTRPDVVVMKADSVESNGIYSNLTQSSSSSREEKPSQPKQRKPKIAKQPREQRDETIPAKRQMLGSNGAIQSSSNTNEWVEFESPAPLSAPRKDKKSRYANSADATSKNVTDRQEAAISITEQGKNDSRETSFTPPWEKSKANGTGTGNRKPNNAFPKAITSTNHVANPHHSSLDTKGYPSTQGPNNLDKPVDKSIPNKRPDVEKMSKNRKHEFQQTQGHADIFDNDVGWVDFGENFVQPPSHKSVRRRSGRGLSESENDSLRQPAERHSFSSVQATKTSSVNAVPSRQEVAVQGTGNLTERLDKWNNKVRTLLSDEDQPVPPSVNSEKKKLPQKAKHQSREKENWQKPKSDWTTFENPFFNSSTENDSEEWQTLGQRVASSEVTKNVTKPVLSGLHSNVTSSSETEENGFPKSIDVTPTDSHSELSHSSLEISNNYSGNQIGKMREIGKNHISDTEDSTFPIDDAKQHAKARQDNIVVWQNAESSSHSQADLYAERPKPIQNLKGKARTTANIVAGGHERSEDDSEPLGGGITHHSETSKSPSSESEFDAFNVYKESDVRRLESIRASDSFRSVWKEGTQKESNLHGAHENSRHMQPNGPLVSKSGQRASAVFGRLSRHDPPTIAEGAPSSNRRGTSEQQCIASFPSSSLTSNPDSMEQQTIVVVQGFPTDVKHPGHQHLPQTGEVTCQVDPRTGCVMGGVQLVEASYQPMSADAERSAPIESAMSDTEDDTLAYHYYEQQNHSIPSQAERYPELGTDPTAMAGQDLKVLNKFLDSYQHESRQKNFHPHTPTEVARPHQKVSFSEAKKPAADHLANPIPLARSSSTLSGILMVDTAPSDDDEDVALNVNHPYDHHDPQNRESEGYLDTQPDFDETMEGPTSPTQLRSSESESTVDEEELRQAAERRGISPDVVEVLINQSRQKKALRAPLKGGLPPIDSDTCQPASARHLRKDVGPTAASYNELMQYSGAWGEAVDSRNEHEASERRTSAMANPRDPSPTAAQAIIAALHENAMETQALRRASMQSVPGMPELPEGATEEELNLLNRFIEVAASNFDGKKLSADSERRVRAAALKVGLSQKFVDQLLEQANIKNESGKEEYAPVSTVGVPTSPDNTRTAGDASTYYTHDMTQFTRKTKKEPEEAGCSVWEQLDSLAETIRGWANCGGTTTVSPNEKRNEENHNSHDDDGSSISSVPSDPFRDELTKKFLSAQRQKHKKSKKSKRTALV